jgi:hypothetical protein
MLAIVEALLGDGAAARRHMDEWYAANIDLDASAYGVFLQAVALVALLEDDPATAAMLAGTLQALLDADPTIPTASGYLHIEDPAETARRRLGDAFEQHFEEGRRLTPQEAVARAHASSRQA